MGEVNKYRWGQVNIECLCSGSGSVMFDLSLVSSCLVFCVRVRRDGSFARSPSGVFFILALAPGANRKGQVKKQGQVMGQKEGTEGGTGRQPEQVDNQNEVNNRMAAFLYYVFVRCCIYFALNPCVSHESRLRVRVFTTAFPGWSMAASSSRPRGTVLSRRRDFSS